MNKKQLKRYDKLYDIVLSLMFNEGTTTEQEKRIGINNAKLLNELLELERELSLSENQ